MFISLWAATQTLHSLTATYFFIFVMEKMFQYSLQRVTAYFLTCMLYIQISNQSLSYSLLSKLKTNYFSPIQLFQEPEVTKSKPEFLASTQHFHVNVVLLVQELRCRWRNALLLQWITVQQASTQRKRTDANPKTPNTYFTTSCLTCSWFLALVKRPPHLHSTTSLFYLLFYFIDPCPNL